MQNEVKCTDNKAGRSGFETWERKIVEDATPLSTLLCPFSLAQSLHDELISKLKERVDRSAIARSFLIESEGRRPNRSATTRSIWTSFILQR